MNIYTKWVRDTKLSQLAVLIHCFKACIFQLFAQGGQNEIVWIIGSMCKACGKLGGSGGMLPKEILILDLLLDTI